MTHITRILSAIGEGEILIVASEENGCRYTRPEKKNLLSPFPDILMTAPGSQIGASRVTHFVHRGGNSMFRQRILVVMLTLMGTLGFHGKRVHAQTLYWEDDFTAENIVGVWAPSASAAFANSVVNADSGDLRVAQTLPDVAGVAIGILDEITSLGDTSITTQVQLTGGDHVELHARRNDATDAAYSAALFDDGNVFLLKFNSLADFSVLGSGTAVDSSGAVLDVGLEDLMLRFDVIGDQLDFWAWRPGEDGPSDPTASAVDPNGLGVGSVGLVVVQGAAMSPGEGLFRSVHVAVPEPSTAVLSCLALIVCLLVWRSNKRSVV